MTYSVKRGTPVKRWWHVWWPSLLLLAAIVLTWAFIIWAVSAVV